MARQLKNEIIKTNEAISYARVSSPKQEDNFSRTAQEKTGLEYANRKGLNIIKSWSCVESASRGDRKNFAEMLSYVKRHKNIQHIIFDVTDRMTRNDMDKIRINDLIINFGKTIHFARTGKVYSKDSSPDDEFMLDIEVAVAKKMAKDISRKTKMGMYEKAAQGWYPASAPVGYLNKDGVIIVDEDKAPFIMEAFKIMADEYNSIAMVVDKLNEKGFRTRRDILLCVGSLQKIYKNKMYYGVFEWGGKEYLGKHTPIITKELFERANTALSEHGGNIQKSTRNHPFNNLIHCPLCNHRLVGDDKGGDRMYYRCSSKIERHAGQKIKYLTEKQLLEHAERIVHDVSMPKNVAVWMQKCLDRELSKMAKSKNKELIKLKKQLTAAENRLQDLKDNAIKQGYAPEIVNYNLDSLKKEIAEYTIKITNIQADINPESIKGKSIDILSFVSKLGYTFNSADKYQKADFLKKIGEKYAYDYDPEKKTSKLLVVYREPFNFFAEGNKSREAILGSPYTNCSKNSISQIWGG